jgi:hypothetical protein
MTPEVQFWRVPAGAEILAVPKELEAPRGQIIHMVAHMMKLYGIKCIRANVSMVGPCGVTSPLIDVMPAFESIRPMAFQATEVTIVRSLIPIMLVYGILGISISLNDQDKNDMLKMWAAMADALPKKETSEQVVIEGEGHGPTPT